MKIIVIRHFPTEGNLNKKYIGRTDESIVKIINGLDYSHISNGCVFVSPLKRAVETADILFPGDRKIIIDNLREMDFGIFENKNYLQLSGNIEYRKWIDSNCEAKCPMGESKKEFCERVIKAVEEIKEIALNLKIDRAVLVAHGGTAMAIGENLALPAVSYFDTKLDFGEEITFTV